MIKVKQHKRKIEKIKFGKKIGPWKVETDLGVFDSSLKHPNNPARKYDFKIIYKPPLEELLFQFKLTNSYIKNRLYGFKKWKKVAFLLQPNYKTGFIYKNLKSGKGGKVPIIVEEYELDMTPARFQEGRTRALIAQELEIKKIPILQAFKRRLNVN